MINKQSVATYDDVKQCVYLGFGEITIGVAILHTSIWNITTVCHLLCLHVRLVLGNVVGF